MGFVRLKNAGITDNAKVDFEKTKTVRLASEKIGKDIYRQVCLVKFTEFSEGKSKQLPFTTLRTLSAQ